MALRLDTEYVALVNPQTNQRIYFKKTPEGLVVAKTDQPYEPPPGVSTFDEVTTLSGLVIAPNQDLETWAGGLGNQNKKWLLEEVSKGKTGEVPQEQQVYGSSSDRPMPEGYDPRTGLPYGTPPTQRATVGSSTLNLQPTPQSEFQTGGLNVSGVGTTGGTGGAPTPPSPTSQQDYDIAQLLSSSTLSEDEKKLIQTIYQYSVDKNEDAAKALIAKLELGKQYADPIYQQKFNLAKDTLERGLASLDTALQYDEQIRQRALERLQSDIIYAKDNLSFQEQQMLGQLERSLGLKLESTRQNLASRGFTDSTRRAEAEQLLQETTGELRESTEREFAAKQKALADQGMRATEDTAAEIKRLQELNLQSKIDIARQAESQLGTGNLPPLEGVTPVGGVTGELELQRKQDLAQFVY